MTSSRWSSRTAYSHVYYHSQSSRYHSQTVAAGAPAERPLSVKDLPVPGANNTPRIVIRQLGIHWAPHTFANRWSTCTVQEWTGTRCRARESCCRTQQRAAKKAFSHNCRPHLSRGGVGDHVIAPYEGAGESVHAQYSCNALVAASWRLYW